LLGGARKRSYIYGVRLQQQQALKIKVMKKELEIYIPKAPKKIAKETIEEMQSLQKLVKLQNARNAIK